LRPAEDSVDRRAQLVREVGKELVLEPSDAFRLDAGVALDFE
jgi:hypothetical protein